MKIEKNEGISLILASGDPAPLQQGRNIGGYYKIRSYQGGGEFFTPENSQLLRQCLGDFLPHAIQRKTGDGETEILYQQMVDGVDICHQSVPLDPNVGIPEGERQRLEVAVRSLKAKQDSPETDPTKREIIRAFRLPSPDKDPELYRIYGKKGSGKLLVLWGVEKEAGSSLVPEQVVAAVPTRPGRERRTGFWAALGVAAAIIFCAFLLFRGSDDEGSGSGEGKQTTQIGSGTSALPPDDRVDGGGAEDNNAPDARPQDAPTPGIPDGVAGGSHDGAGTPGSADSDGTEAGGGLTQNGSVSPLPEPPTSGASRQDGTVKVIAGPELSGPEGSIDPDWKPVARDGGEDEINLAKRISPAVVTLAVGNSLGGYDGLGTGFLITEDGTVVTSEHVVKNKTIGLALLADGREIKVEGVLIADARRDLALIKLSSQGTVLPFLRLGEPESAVVGGPISVMGSPLGLAGSYSAGLVSAMRKVGGVRQIQFTAPVSPGSSGSPVVDQQALVVGIVKGGIDMSIAQALNFAVDVAELHDLLAEAPKEVRTQWEEGRHKVAVNTRDPGTSGLAPLPVRPQKPVTWPDDPTLAKILPPPAPTPKPEPPGPGDSEIAPQPPDPSAAKADSPTAQTSPGREPSSVSGPIKPPEPDATPVQPGPADPPPPPKSRIVAHERGHKAQPDGKIEVAIEIMIHTPEGHEVPLDEGLVVFEGKEIPIQDNRVILVGQSGNREFVVRGQALGNPVAARFSIDILVRPEVRIEEK